MKNPETKNYDQNDYDGGGIGEGLKMIDDMSKIDVYKFFFINP